MKGGVFDGFNSKPSSVPAQNHKHYVNANIYNISKRCPTWHEYTMYTKGKIKEKCLMMHMRMRV